MDRVRLSFNQYTCKPWTLKQAVAACVHRDIPAIALWRDKIADHGLERAAALVRAAGLRVSSICRGGFFPSPSATERAKRIDDNRRAIEEAAAFGAPVLVLVCGPAEGQPLAAARAQVAEGIAAIAGDAAAAGVRVAIEPLHPMMIAERSVVATLEEANDIADAIGSPAVGVICDVYHAFWDARVEREIARAGPRLAGFHLSDWKTPRGDVTADRAMIGDGCIEIPALAAAMSRAGYSGDIEIEILNATAWQTADLNTWLDTAVARYTEV
jgi:sugar phosphate isomerase/epimerase